MQQPFRGSPHATTAAGGGIGGGEAYDSFIDFDGFPAGGASYASSPASRSNSTATTSINIDYTSASNVRKLDHASAVVLDDPVGGSSGEWMGRRNAPGSYPMLNNNRLAMAASSTPVVNWPVEEKLDWPVEEQFEHEKEHQFHHQNQQPQPQRLQPQPQSPPSRDQQIFRRKGGIAASGSASTHPSFSSRASSVGAHGEVEKRSFPNAAGRGGIMFESANNTTKNSNPEPPRDNFGSGGRNALILDNIVEAAARIDRPATGLAKANIHVSQAQRNGVHTKRDGAGEPSTTSRSSASKSRGSTSSPVVSKKEQLPSPPKEQSIFGGSSISPQSVIRKTGVVNKLVSLFSTKQQPLSSSSRSGITPKSNASLSTNRQSMQQLNQATTTGVVQFHVPTTKHPQMQAGATATSASSIPTTFQSQNNHNNQGTSSNTQIPAISPARSNAQSSVTGYSGDSSSYNPTGWPGTVDRRGKTYAMEPSYSESEESSLASPQRRSSNRAGVAGNGRQYPTLMERDEMSRPPQSSSQINQGDKFPVQNYRRDELAPQQQLQKDFSFDNGGDSSAVAAGKVGLAELEDWLNGSTVDDFSIYGGDQSQFSQSHAGQSQAAASTKSRIIDLDDAYSMNVNERRSSGPIDLDEAYEHRFDSGWGEEGREESLANISETKTAADIQLEAALGMNNQSLRQTQTTPNKSLGTSNAGGGTGSSHSYHTPQPIKKAPLDEQDKLQGIDLRGSEERVRAYARQLHPDLTVYNEEVDFDCSYDASSPPQPSMQQQSLSTLSEEALRYNDSTTAPPRAGGNLMLRGYRGFIDKTKDVPNLMDDLESEASMGTGVYSRQTIPARSSISGVSGRPSSIISSSNGIDSGSDVFEGIQEEQHPFGLPMEKDILKDVTQRQQPASSWKAEAVNAQMTQPSFANFERENLPYSTHFNPFTASSNHRAKSRLPNDASNSAGHQNSGRTNKVDFIDPSLDISAISNGSANAYSHHLGVEEEPEIENDFESLPDLSIYCIEPEIVRKMVRAFRKICTSQMEISSNSEETMLYDFEHLVDTKKAFALFEMRSRIMETDIDRGLERRGGTNVVDDTVLTPYFQAASRVRDAVIVSKAWRDGATPKDVITAHLLTRRSARAHFVRRPIRRIRRPGVPHYNHGPQYWLEEVKWIDDTDFMLMRCQSLGAGTMKGFEMFTIGDCQSILLKMTSDNCMQLRRELRSAMVRQIEAEELMQEEIDLDGDENIVAEAEQLYRDATVEVKTLSYKLVLADKSFALVRNRMEKLVETIESLLVSIENGDGGSATDEGTSSSMHSYDEETDNDSYVSHESQDKVKLVERAKRAELSAEVAVREALLAKQEAQRIRSDKQLEIDDLKVKLAEMETQSQLLASEHQRMVYAGAGQAKNSSHYLDDAKSFLESTFDKEHPNETARKHRLKQKFRQRRTQLEDVGQASNQNQPSDEEIYQRLDFYSRSLKSVS